MKLAALSSAPTSPVLADDLGLRFARAGGASICGGLLALEAVASAPRSSDRAVAEEAVGGKHTRR